MSRAKSSIFDPALLRPAILDSFYKLDPRTLDAQPGHVRGRDRLRGDDGHLRPRPVRRATGDAAFVGQLSAWLWFTVLFANFAEAVAEGRGKAQADTLRKTRTETVAMRLATSTTSTANVFPRRSLAAATSCSSWRATSSPATAT